DGINRDVHSCPTRRSSDLSGIVALHGELMAPELLRSMVREALPHPKDSSCEQTIIATAVKLGGEFFPKKLSLVEFDDVYRFRSRSEEHTSELQSRSDLVCR